MLCLFGTTGSSRLNPDINLNPLICDCLDFEIYSLAHLFQRGLMLDNLFCDWPLEHRGERVNNLYFPRLTIGDNSLFAQLFD